MAGLRLNLKLAALAIAGPLLAWTPGARAWPALYRDCSVFPELGQPQPRPVKHPPLAWFCEPHAPATFEWCARNCAALPPPPGLPYAGQNCSRTMCTCKERCMGTADVCTGAGANPPADGTHVSLPDTLSARPGDTTMLLDGQPPRHYTAGRTHRLTVVPNADASNLPTWFLVDAGVGAFSAAAGSSAAAWKVACQGTRVSFKSTARVELLWTAPAPSAGALPVTLRVAAATSMGNLSVTAAVLNATSATLPLPPHTMGYACTAVQGFTTFAKLGGVSRQCQSVPIGTVGAQTLQACEAACFRPPTAASRGVYRCTRCTHAYDPRTDGGPNRTRFEDLPDSWSCPTCGAPKSAYARQVAADGSFVWAHDDHDDE